MVESSLASPAPGARLPPRAWGRQPPQGLELDSRGAFHVARDEGSGGAWERQGQRRRRWWKRRVPDDQVVDPEYVTRAKAGRRVRIVCAEQPERDIPFAILAGKPEEKQIAVDRGAGVALLDDRGAICFPVFIGEYPVDHALEVAPIYAIHADR